MSILDRPEPSVPLPAEWPRVAKSAILDAVALAHLVVTRVHGWCADRQLRRVRLAAECERLRSEVALLREELRIKDARLARIPARNRPHLSFPNIRSRRLPRTSQGIGGPAFLPSRATPT